MNALTQADRRFDAYRKVRERCRQLGLAVWRTNGAGLVLEEPQDAGLPGLWLRAGVTGQLVSRAASNWDAAADPEVHELFPGCWLIPVPEIHRRRLHGYTVAMAMAPGALEDRTFDEICRSAHLDIGATRRSLRSVATFDVADTRRLQLTLKWMVGDLQRHGENEETIAGFTGQLTNAYETIDLLYALGRSMNEPNEPAQFVDHALDRLHGNMDFAWAGALFVDDPRLAPMVNARFFWRGRPTMNATDLECAVRRLVDELHNPIERQIASDLAYFAPDGGPQVIVQPVLRDAQVAGYLIAGEKGGIDPQVSSYDTHVIEAAAGYLGPFLENAGLYSDQQAMFLGTLKALTAAIDAKDRYTCGHSERVAHLAARLAEAMGLPKEHVERIHIAGLVHDVGKIGVPEEVLGKAGKLTEEEFSLIKLHPEIGFRILKDIPLLQDVLPGVLHHHERWDGRGYPHGLMGDHIPLPARIIGLVDTFDAMSSTRSYRPAMPRDKVLAEIQRCAGSQFDPELVPAFFKVDLAMYDEMVARSTPQTPVKAREAA